MAVARFKPSREMSTGAPPTGTTSPRCYSARDAGLREAARVLRTAVDVARFKPPREMSTGAPPTGTTSPNTRCYSARDAGLREAARVLRTATSKNRSSSKTGTGSTAPTNIGVDLPPSGPHRLLQCSALLQVHAVCTQLPLRHLTSACGNSHSRRNLR